MYFEYSYPFTETTGGYNVEKHLIEVIEGYEGFTQTFPF